MILTASTTQVIQYSCCQAIRLLAFIAWLFVLPANAGSESQPPPTYTLQDTPAGTVFQLGNHVQLFKNMQVSELLAKLIAIPVGGFLVSLSANTPTYLLFILSPLIHRHPKWAPDANDVANQLRVLIRYTAIMYTLRSAYELAYNTVRGSLLPAEMNLEQWYQWARCDHRLGYYPVFITAPELASLFHLQVFISEEGIAHLDITLIGDPNIKSPLPWQKLASAMKSRRIPSLTLTIEKNGSETKLKLNPQFQKERIITLDDSALPWDINLMGKWCSQSEPTFHSVFHPGFILAVAYVLNNPDITDLMSYEPVQLSDQSLLQTGSATLYTFSDGNDQHQIIWSDQSADYGGPGFIVWSMNQHLDHNDLTVAGTDMGPEIFRARSAQQQWSREMVMLIEVITSTLFSAKIEHSHQKMLRNMSKKMLTLPAPTSSGSTAPRIGLPSAESPQTEIASVSESRAGNLLRAIFKPMHTAMMRSPGKTLSHWVNPAHLLHRLFPVNLFRPMYMVDPDEYAGPSPVSSDTSPPEKGPPEKGPLKKEALKKEALKKAASEMTLTKKKNSWSKKRTASSHSLPGRNGSLKHKKGSQKWGDRRGSVRSIGSTTSSQSSGSHSKHGSMSRHSSSGRLVSSGSDTGVGVENTRLLELMGYDDEDSDNLHKWLFHGFSDDLIPDNPLLIELTQTALKFLRQAISEASTSVAQLPGLVAKTSTEPLKGLQTTPQIEVLLGELTVLESLFNKLMLQLEKPELTDSDLQIDSMPIHEFWLQQFQQLHRLGIEFASPPMAAFRNSFPVPLPLVSDNREALIKSITQFQTQLREMKMVIQESLRNPVLVQGVLVDPAWFDICTEFETNSRSLLQDARDLDNSDEFFHVDLELIRNRIQKMQDQLYSIYQLSTGRLSLQNPQTRQAFFSEPDTADNHLLRRILLGEEPINWPDVSLAQLDLLNRQLTEDVQNMKEQLVRVYALLQQAPPLPPFFHKHIYKLIMGQKLETLEDVVKKAEETQQWLDSEHRTIHTKIVTSKEIEKGQGDVDVRVDIYEPILTRLAFLNHRLIVACGDWRTGCPAMGSILAITVESELESAADRARKHLTQMEIITDQLTKQRAALHTMGPLYSKFVSNQTMLTAFLKQCQQWIGVLSDKTLTGSSDPIVSSVFALLDSLAALEPQLEEFRMTELGTEEVVQIMLRNALEFDPALFPMKQQLLSQDTTSDLFASFQTTEVIAMIRELHRLIEAALHTPLKAPNQNQSEQLRWSAEILVAMKQHVQQGHLMISRHLLDGLKRPTPFIAQWSAPEEQTVLEFVLARYQDLLTELPWLGTDPAKVKPASTRKAPKVIDSSLQELKPRINQAASAMTMEIQLWKMLQDSVLRPSVVMSRMMETVWRIDSTAPSAILPDELHQLPFSEEIQLLWQQNDATTSEATLDTDTPSDTHPSTIGRQETITPENTGGSHNFAVQVYQPTLDDPGVQYQAHLQKAQRRHKAKININGWVQSWKVQVNTPISYASEEMGGYVSDPVSTPPFPLALAPVPAWPDSQHKAVQCDIPSVCLAQRYQLFHFNRGFPVKLATSMSERCITVLTQLKGFQSSLHLMNKSNAKNIIKVLSNTETLKKELQECWRSSLPTMESFLPRAPVGTSPQQP